jgi:hypothetical protein
MENDVDALEAVDYMRRDVKLLFALAADAEVASLRRRDFDVTYTHCHHLALVNLNVVRVRDSSEGIPRLLLRLPWLRLCRRSRRRNFENPNHETTHSERTN